MILPVILSGGAGTRLRPLSRDAAPKPFMVLPDGETLVRFDDRYGRAQTPATVATC
jgi:mannose-1-phosphate guanylyltransferase